MRDSYFARLDRAPAKITCLRGLLTGEPLSVTFYRDRGLAGLGAAHAGRGAARRSIFVFSSNMAPYVLGRKRRGAGARWSTSPTWTPRNGAPTPRTAPGADALGLRREWRKTADAGAPHRPRVRLVHLRLRRGGGAVRPARAGAAQPRSARSATASTTPISTRRTASSRRSRRTGSISSSPGTMDYPPNVDAVRLVRRRRSCRCSATAARAVLIVGSSPAAGGPRPGRAGPASS